MLGRLMQVVAAAIALIALRARVVRVPMPETALPISRGVSYPQLRHLIVSTVFLALLIVGGIWFASRTLDVLTPLAISIILAVALRPTVDRIQRLPGGDRRLPRPVAILAIYLLLAIVAAGIGFLVIPAIAAEIQKLIVGFPDYVKQLDAELQSLRRYTYMPDIVSLEGQVVSQLLSNLSQALSLLILAINFAGGILSIGAVLVFTFFLIMDAEQIHEHVLSLVPPSGRENAREMSGKMGRKIEGWLKGTILLAIILGAVTTVMMYALDMPFPHLLGLAAAIFELVPILGPYLGATPAVSVALFSQPLWKLIAVLAYFVVIQQVENSILAPQIMGRQVDLPPLLVILALLLGATLMGIIGALLAVPVAAVVHVLWTDLVVPEIKRRQTG